MKNKDENLKAFKEKIGQNVKLKIGRASCRERVSMVV